MILMMTLGLEIFLRAGSMTIWGGTGRPDAARHQRRPAFHRPHADQPRLCCRRCGRDRDVRFVRAVLPHADAASCCAPSPTTTPRRGRSASPSSAAWRCRGRCRRWSRPSPACFGASVQGVDQSLAQLLLKGVTVAVLGGLDSIGGALLAGVLLGVVEGVASSYLDPLLGGAQPRSRRCGDADPHYHDPAARPVRPPRHREGLSACCSGRPGSSIPTTPRDRALFPIAADRWMIGMLLAARAGRAAAGRARCTLSSYLLPWLVWTAARSAST